MSKFTGVVMVILFMLMGQGIVFGQEKTIKVTGDIKGLDAMQVCIMAGEKGSAPREVGSAVADKGRFQITFKEDPSLGIRYGIYIPALDDESRSNNNSRKTFFVDNTEIRLTGRIKDNGFKEFDVPASAIFQEYKIARGKIDFSKYEKLKFAENKAHAGMSDFKQSKDEGFTGKPMNLADSAALKEMQKAWKEAAKSFFDSEYELGSQALAQVDRQKENKGLNALVFDFFSGCSETGLQPVIDKYLSAFSADYMKKDYYLVQLYEDYKRFHMSEKGMEIVEFDLVDMKDKAVRFGDFKGKYVYINFWDLEDPEFELQQNALEKMRDKYKDNKNIVFINLSMNQDLSLWKARLEGYKLKVLQWSLDSDSRFYKAYQVREFPRAVLLDKESRMLEFKMGVPADPQTVEYLDLLLK